MGSRTINTVSIFAEGFSAASGDVHAPRRLPDRIGGALATDERYAIVSERFFEPELAGLRRIVDPVKVEMLDSPGVRERVTVTERERGACDGRLTSKTRDDPHERRLPRAELPVDCDDVPRDEKRGESARPRSTIARSQETVRRTGNARSVYWRLDDIVVGVITGAVCSVLAAVIEGFIATLRVFSFGRIGGGIGVELLSIALVGAILGGIVGIFLGALVTSREMSR